MQYGTFWWRAYKNKIVEIPTIKINKCVCYEQNKEKLMKYKQSIKTAVHLVSMVDTILLVILLIPSV